MAITFYKVSNFCSRFGTNLFLLVYFLLNRCTGCGGDDGNGIYAFFGLGLWGERLFMLEGVFLSYEGLW